MKPLYALLLAALTVGSLLAQQPAETSVLNSRLIATSTEKWTSGSWAEQDSSFLVYSGTRGGELVQGSLEADYDTRQTWYWQNGTPTNTNLYEKTYDAENRLIQEVVKVWVSGAWTNASRETNTYGPFGITNILVEEWDGNAWVGDYRISYTFDAAGNETTGQRDIWSGGMWVGSVKTISTYNANNQRTTKVTQNLVSNNWRNQSRDNYTFDAAGNVITAIYESWNSVSNVWQFSSRTFLTYTATDKLATQVRQAYTNGNWVEDTRETWTYNGQGYLTRNLKETYASGAWQNAQRTDYTPNSLGLFTETIRYTWANGTWNENNRTQSTFDAAGNILTSLSSIYVSGTWNDQYYFVYTNNAFNQRVTQVFQENFGNGLENNTRTFYYYDTYEDGTSGITAWPTLSSSVLPNPFTINVAIQLQVTDAGSHTFEVYNMAGQRVHAESRHLAPGQQAIVWDAAETPKGVYFYKVYTQNGVASGKLIKQ